MQSPLTSFSTSLFLHALLAGLILWTAISQSQQYKIRGKSQIIDTVLISHLNTPQSHVQHKQLIAKQQQTQHTKTTPQHKIKSIRRTTHSTQAKQLERISASTYNKLVELIYRAVKQRQVYPEHAAMLNHVGNVTLQMTLHPDGNITDIRIIQSSGHHDLDAAAIQSLQAAAPIRQVQNLLPHTAVFNVPILYQ